MEDRKLSEKESLDIITQMINSSKRNMKVGSGNVLLYLGVFYRALIGRDILFDSVYAKNYIWSWGWMLMFAVGPVISYKQRGCEPAVVTYTDKTISSVWQVFGCMFGLTFVLIAAFCVLYEQSVNFILMLPLSLLYCGFGGVDKWHYLAGEMDDLLSGSCFRLSYLHADEFDKSWSCHGLVVFVFWPFICGNDDYSRAYS